MIRSTVSKRRDWYWATNLLMPVWLFFSLSVSTITAPTSLLPSLNMGKILVRWGVLPVAFSDHSRWTANAGFTISIWCTKYRDFAATWEFLADFLKNLTVASCVPREWNKTDCETTINNGNGHWVKGALCLSYGAQCIHCFLFPNFPVTRYCKMNYFQ